MEPPAPVRVLCVDDNEDYAASTALLLRLNGFEAESAFDGPDALTTADTFRPDVCFVDLNMPGMDGDVLAPLLRERLGRKVVLICLTAMTSAASRERVRKAGFDYHLVKPVDPEFLCELLAGTAAREG